MSEFSRQYEIGTYISRNILIVPLQIELYVDVIEALREDILDQLHNNPNITGLIIDVSKVNLLDLRNMQVIEDTLQMAQILGVIGFIVGLQPNITLALVELGYEPTAIHTALNIEHAMILIDQGKQQSDDVIAEGNTDQKMIETHDDKEHEKNA